jgi:pimeloyl-ACP methyl ester carboxylesterase
VTELDPADLDPARFEVHHFEGRGFRQAYVRVNPGGVPLLCVHGWPETKRIWWRVVEPLAAAGFEVIVPDLRGFGDSDVAPDGFHDVASHSRDLHALVTSPGSEGGLGHERVVSCGGDLGGPVIQDLALRFPEAVERMVLFNSPLPYDKEAMAGMDTRPRAGAADYFLRQGTDPDGLAAELDTPEQRRSYIATFYTSRFWAHPGAFTSGQLPGGPAVDFHTEPFADAAKLRASFGGYESAFSEAARSEPALLARNPDVETLLLFGPSDHVLYPAFDEMAAVTFPDHVGPFLLRDCGHFVPWEAPHQLVSATRAFCRDLLA